jgi:Fe-S cluster assembly protein SufD
MSNVEKTILEPWVGKGFKEFISSLNGGSKLPVHNERLRSFENLSSIGFPSPLLEDWRYTNIIDVIKADYVLPSSLSKITQSEIESLSIPGIDSRLVFLNGMFQSDLSVSFTQDSKAQVGSIDAALHGKYGALIQEKVTEKLTKLSNEKNQAIDSLNTAFLRDGAFVYLPKQAVLDDVFHILFLTKNSTEKYLVAPRILVVAEEESSVTIVESHVSLDSKQIYFSAPVLEAFVGSQARVDYYKVVNESPQALHLGNSIVQTARDSNFRYHVCTFGGGTVRNETEIAFTGSNSNALLNGLSVIGDKQLVDNHTVLRHAVPHCESIERFKGVYAGKSKGVFNGTIIVSPDAQKTNAIQSNQSILLSKDATIDTQPQLKIWADDVKCTHGATIGQLDETALFYLRSRGLDRETALKVLVQAFASDIISGVLSVPLKAFLQALLDQQLNKLQAD